MKRTTAFGGALAIMGVVALTVAGSIAQAADPRPPMMGQMMMTMLDTNKDQVISADEIKAHLEERFAAFDQDSNGSISKDEFEKAKPAMPMDGKGHGPMMDDKGPGKMHAAHQEQMFKLMDTNADGVVSREEFQAHEHARFKDMDTNNDGQITADELKAMPMGGPGGERPKK